MVGISPRRADATICHGKDYAGNKVIEDGAMGRVHGPNLTRGKGSRTAQFRSIFSTPEISAGAKYTLQSTRSRAAGARPPSVRHVHPEQKNSGAPARGRTQPTPETPMKILKRKFGLAALACASGLLFPLADVRAQTVSSNEADAWSFPYAVQPMNYSGIYQMDVANRLLPLCKHLGRTLTWKSLNPEEGVYDFSYIDQQLDLAEAGDYMVVFRLKASIVYANPMEKGQNEDTSRTIPDWVLTKYGIDADDRFLTKDPADPAPPAAPHYKEYVAPWHNGVQEEFRKLVQEINARRYLERGGFMGIYLHGVSGSFGEEMSVDSPFTGRRTRWRCITATMAPATLIAGSTAARWRRRSGTAGRSG
jgi:hypothetical protein